MALLKGLAENEVGDEGERCSKSTLSTNQLIIQLIIISSKEVAFVHTVNSAVKARHGCQWDF